MSTSAFSGTLTITPGGSGISVNQSMSNSNASSPVQVVTVNLTTTPTALTIPSTARIIIIQPGTGLTANVVVGGTGVSLANMLALDPANTSVLSVPASATMEVAIATGTGSITVTYA